LCIKPKPGYKNPGSGSGRTDYFRQQAAPLWQQDDPLQQPAFADFANELPNVNIKRAARLSTLIVSFFM